MDNFLNFQAYCTAINNANFGLPIAYDHATLYNLNPAELHSYCVRDVKYIMGVNQYYNQYREKYDESQVIVAEVLDRVQYSVDGYYHYYGLWENNTALAAANTT